ncbi:MAG: FecR domain-containing protein [bacterium]|nr:FecR domain-containing protein [bacterium]
MKNARHRAAVCTAALLLAGAAGGATPGREATIARVHRVAERLRPPVDTWAPAAAGMTVARSDSIRTASNSYADLELDPRNRFRVMENALVRIDRLADEEREASGAVVRLTELGLLKGRIVAKLDALPADARLSLRTPAAVAAVRGTSFLMGVGPDGSATAVAVSAGAVRVQATGEPRKFVALGPDRGTLVAPWGTALIEAKGTGLPPKTILLRRLEDPTVPLADARRMLERLKDPKPSLENLVIGAAAEASAQEGEGAAAATEAAGREARRLLLETLRAVRLSGEETVGDVMDGDPAVCRALLAAAAGLRPVKAEYGKDERRALVRLELPLDEVRKITGRDIALAWTEITPVTLADYAAAFGGFIRVAAERAATVDAYRRLAEKIHGTVVDSSTTLRDLAVEDDRITVAVKGVVQGAEEVSKTHYSDGSVEVVLRVRGDAVRGAVPPAAGELLGAHYMASPAAVTPEEFIRLLALGDI